MQDKKKKNANYATKKMLPPHIKHEKTHIPTDPPRTTKYICVNMNLKSYIIDTSFKELGNEYTKLTKHEGMIFLVIDHDGC